MACGGKAYCEDQPMLHLLRRLQQVLLWWHWRCPRLNGHPVLLPHPQESAKRPTQQKTPIIHPRLHIDQHHLPPKSLTSLQLIFITTGLVALSLAADVYGNSFSGDQFWSGGWCDESKKNTKYTANVSLGKRKKQDLIKSLHMGERVRLEDLLKRRQNSMENLGSEKAMDEEWQHVHL